MQSRLVVFLVLACLVLPLDALAREVEDVAPETPDPNDVQTPDAARPLAVDVVPATFREAPDSFRFNLSEGPLASADVDQVVTIRFPTGLLGAPEAPTPPAGWRVTAYDPDGAPAYVELVAVATQQVREYMAVRLGVLPFTCASDTQAFTWTIRIQSATASVDETREETTACDRIPPRLVHVTGDAVASVRIGSVDLAVALADDPLATAPVYAKVNLTLPNGTILLQNVTDGVANVSLGEGDGGVWRYHVEARDAAGNPLRVPDEGDFFLNVSEPAADVTLVGAPNGTWHNATPTVSLSMDDPGSDASVLNWSVVSDPADAAPTPSEGVGAADVALGSGNHTVHVHTTDALGASVAETPLVVKVDAVVPTATLLANRTVGEGGWVAGPVTVDFLASFGPSGEASATWTLDGTSVEDASVELTDQADHVLAWRVESVAGLVNASEKTLRVDLTPPIATLDLSGDVTTGPYRGAVLVTGTATDERGGIASRELVVNGTDVLPYTGPVLFEGEGEYTILFRATDFAGHVGEASAAFSIDDTAPSLVLQLDNVTGRTLANERTWLNVSIVESSVATVACTLNGTVVTLPVEVVEGGTHTATCTATDVAGNPAAPAQLTFYVDREAPLVGDLGDLGATNEPLFENTTSDVAGVAAVEARYVDAEGATFAHPLAEPLADGAYTLQLRATDVFGHTSLWRDALGFTLATAAPAPAFDASPEDGAWTREATYAWTLPEHVVEAWVEASVDGAAFARAESPLVVTGDGTHTILLRAADEAGNVGDDTTFTARIDTLAPDVTEPLDARVYTKAATFSWVPTAQADDGAPVFLSMAVDGEAVDDVSLTDEGTHAVVYRAVDEAGNEGPLYTSLVAIDRTAPLAVLADVATSTTSGRLAWAAEDASPVAGVDARIVLANGTEVALADANETGASYAGLPEGEHAVEVAFTDAAGNAGAAIRRALVVDLTRPTVVLEAPEWTRATVEATVTASDALAGVARVRLVVTDDAGEADVLSKEGASATFKAPVEGDVELRGVAVDAVGNEISSTAAIVRFDARAPRILIAQEPRGAGLVATITDDRSAPDAEYRICGNVCTGWAGYDGFLVRTTPGFWLVEFRAEDDAGNTAVRSATFAVQAHEEEDQDEEGAGAEDAAADEGAPVTETQDEVDEADEPVVLDEPLPGTKPEPREIERVVLTSARREDGKLYVDGPLVLHGDELRAVTFRIGNGTPEVAVGGVIPDKLLAAGETFVEVSYEWSDGVTTREWLVVVREDAEPEESLEQTSVSPTPPQGGAAAKSGVPGAGVGLALVAVALVAALRRR